MFVHEFGHHLAALADEYYTSDVAYLPPTERVEPWEPNVTALLDPANAQVEGPRARRARRFRRRGRRRSSRATSRASRSGAGRSAPQNRPEAEMDALFREEMAHDTACSKRRRTPARSARSRAPTTRRRGYLPAAGRLHHVHARPGAVLRRVPPRHRTDPRPLLAMNRTRSHRTRSWNAIIRC